jgi:hypothetical protein
MTEHESNLLDLYAGMAMMGWIMNGDYREETIPYMAHDIAQHMLQVRKERASARQAEERTVPDMAVSDMEGREDSDTQGIAALKKTKARPKPT